MEDQLAVVQWLAQKLDEAGIAYMFTGSMALTFYSIPRMTRDIDIVVEIDMTHLDRLMSLFSETCYIDRASVQRAIESAGMFNIIHQGLLIKADFIVRKPDAYRVEEFRRRREVQVGTTRLSVVSPEDLLLSKLVWAKDTESEMQMRDVEQLVRNLPDLDWHYIDAWADTLAVYHLVRKIRNND